MVIYKIINLINDKIYIGKTIHDNSEYYGSGILIKHAIKKYGIDNFKKEIIDTASSIIELNNKEKYWIAFHNSTNLKIGYNIGKGGDIFTGHPRKEQIRKKFSHTGKNNPMFGRKHTRKTIKQISKHKKGQRKGIPTWSKGKSLKNYSEGYRRFFESCKNRLSPTSKNFIFVSPKGQIFKVFGSFEKFCTEHKIDVYTARHFLNKGKVSPPRKGRKNSNGTPKIERINLTGWEIKN